MLSLSHHRFSRPFRSLCGYSIVRSSKKPRLPFEGMPDGRAQFSAPLPRGLSKNGRKPGRDALMRGGWESDPRVSALAGRGIAGVPTNHTAALNFPRRSTSASGGLCLTLCPISSLESIDILMTAARFRLFVGWRPVKIVGWDKPFACANGKRLDRSCFLFWRNSASTARAIRSVLLAPEYLLGMS